MGTASSIFVWMTYSMPGCADKQTFSESWTYLPSCLQFDHENPIVLLQITGLTYIAGVGIDTIVL
jgi:hypothetical protein